MHLIAEATAAYKSSRYADTFMICHDRLSILWDTVTQKWLKTLKCPIEGWSNRTWADHFIQIRGKYNEGVSDYYKNSLPGDSPELMPLDNHLFADVKEGVAQNVAFSFFLPDNDPDKYSLRTPVLVFNAVERTICNGCPSQQRMMEDILRIPETMKRIKEAKGAYIDDSSLPSNKRKRDGVCGAAEAESYQKLDLIDPTVQLKFEAMVDQMLDGKGVPFWKSKDEQALTQIEDQHR